ncbi:hypothetical protein V8E54_008209 [Elaphomyces granulatus]
MTMDSSLEALRNLVQTHPAIDNHAHNILTAANALNYSQYPLELLTTEARGSAIEVARTTLPHYRAVQQLAGFFECEAQWEAVKKARDAWVKRDYVGLVKKCLKGTHQLLLDDLLTEKDVEPILWHDQFTAAPSRRIIRIEAIASRILKTLKPETKADLQTRWNQFQRMFTLTIQSSIQSSKIVGFKSVIGYRTGLEVDVDIKQKDPDRCSFAQLMDDIDPERIANKPFNDWLVVHTVELLQGSRKPIQFHTGLGDSDLILTKANPAHLQPLIARYTNVDFVLLHASYPHTRDGGYLSSVYPNVYLDLGEVFGMLSRDAEESVIRQSLEVTPMSRLLWSTDGHFHPESFWVANKHFRDALETVLVDYVKRGDYTVLQAMDAAADILFNNSNRLYGLGLPTPTMSKSAASILTMTDTPIKPAVTSARPVLDAMLQSHPDSFIWMQFVDYTATVRLRMFPIREFVKIVQNKRRVGISLAVLSMLQDDYLAPGGSPTGQFYLEPDLSTLCRNAGVASNSATVMTFWRTERGDAMQGCPRTILQDIVTKLKNEFQLTVRFGFEIEVVLLKSPEEDGHHPLTTVHSWSNMTAEIRKVLPLLEEIVTTLDSIGLHIEQFHAESSPGQFEFILPHESPLLAVDQLIKARQTINHVVEKHGYRATLYPRPYPKGAGTASHSHFSISPVTNETSFLAGILEHFPAVVAFSLSQEISYSRVAAGIWSGGEWVAWGTQNRETPIRQIAPGHWEMKSLDGLANMYIAMAALMAAGYLGMTSKMPLNMKDCTDDPSTLTPEQRSSLGITTTIPKTLEQSLSALEANDPLQRLLGPEFVRNYCRVKRAERAKFAAMGESERMNFLVDRY